MISQWIKFLDSVIPAISHVNVSMFVYCDTLGVIELTAFLAFLTKTYQQPVTIVNLDTVIEVIGKNQVSLKGESKSRRRRELFRWPMIWAKWIIKRDRWHWLDNRLFRGHGRFVKGWKKLKPPVQPNTAWAYLITIKFIKQIILKNDCLVDINTELFSIAYFMRMLKEGRLL